MAFALLMLLAMGILVLLSQAQVSCSASKLPLNMLLAGPHQMAVIRWLEGSLPTLRQHMLIHSTASALSEYRTMAVVSLSGSPACIPYVGQQMDPVSCISWPLAWPATSSPDLDPQELVEDV